MLDFEVQRCTRRCAKTDREFQPGESFVSALVLEGNGVKRLDFASEASDQIPADAIATWRSQMPGGGKRAHWAPHDVMLDYFVRLQGDAANEDTRYVLALLMVRRRILRLENTQINDAGDEFLVLYCPRHETEYQVRVFLPSDDRAAEIQAKLSQLLVTPGG